MTGKLKVFENEKVNKQNEKFMYDNEKEAF